MRLVRSALAVVPVAFAITVSACGTGSPRFTSTSSTSSDIESELEGIASYYAEEFDGRQTANGETYDMNALTCAHRTLPFNTRLKVTNLENGSTVILRVNDRGPFKAGRIVDVSLSAAKQLGMIPTGTARVRLTVLSTPSR